VFPFAGIDEHRNWPATGLTTARWVAEIPAEHVLFCHVWLTQRHVDVAALFGVTLRKSDQHPHCVAWNGRLHVEDGHHRVVRAALYDRLTGMPMRIYRSKEPA
jgi:hypothetical protein